MSAENFETQAQNKRYLGDTVSSLIAEAKDPSTDSFEDVPFDFRHHKEKPKLKFPDEWLLTEERKAELEAKRKARQDNERQRFVAGQVADGVRAISEGRRINVERVEAPMMAEARIPIPKGKMGRGSMVKGT